MAAHEHHYPASRAGVHGFLGRLTHVRLTRLIVIVLAIFILIPLVAHYFLSNDVFDGGGSGQTSDGHRSRELHEEISSSRAADLKYQIEELKRIKASVNNELRDLEDRRQRLHAEISGYNTHIDELKNSYERTRYELDQLKVTIENTRLEQEEIVRRNMPQVEVPKRVLPSLQDLQVAPLSGSEKNCAMHSCFDYSQCPLVSGFPVYLYDTDKYFSVASQDVDTFIKLSVSQAINVSPYVTKDPRAACIYVVVIGEVKGKVKSALEIQSSLEKLPYWNGDGRNHVLLNLVRYYGNKDLFAGVNTGRAMVAQSTFTGFSLRPGFDIVIAPSLGLSHGDVWDEMSPLVPANRKHLISFQGEYLPLKPVKTLNLHRLGTGVNSQYTNSSILHFQKSPDVKLNNEVNKEQYRDIHGAKQDPSLEDFRNLAGDRPENQLDQEDSNPNVMPHFRNLLSVPNKYKSMQSSNLKSNNAIMLLEELDSNIVEALKKLQARYPSDDLWVVFSCGKERIPGLPGEWSLCGSDVERADLLRDSTFALIIAPTNITVATTTLIQVRLYEALKHGAIPVILGDHLHLPFAEILLWRRASVSIPKARITELHFILRSFSDADILEMRHRGRIFWETYFGTTNSIVNTILAALRTRLGIPAAPVVEEKTPSVFVNGAMPLQEEIPDVQLQTEDILGPIEAPFASPRYQRNFTTLEDSFSLGGDPFHAYPATPFEPVMPGEAKFRGSGLGFRPIGKGEGGAGRAFSEALGGNLPREQFTIVMLTYEREAVLIDAIARLKSLPHLNKVLVVWNNPQPPADDLRWPDIGVPVLVVKTAKNSLNNRFLPYDAIETDAILSIDDDAHLRHDEIVFGFRVWRENRERIVGFPGRFHAWDLKDQAWRYNSNYSCELSMVLTGAAFFHKYYSFLYSYVMPQAIRDKVDEYLNCEDLAMNFLVSHITRKPPIKVTSRWTFRCPGCPNALSVDDSHFQERHKCINFFVKVYGYMPLLYTQYRADSVLFKTRIPHDKQKCFKFI